MCKGVGDHMGIVLSLQGGMAAGKTTAAKFVERSMKGIYVSYENPASIVSEIRHRGLSYNSLDSFVEIQRLFINAEIERYKSYEHYPLVLQDLGAEEIEFYTLHYPKVRGFTWDIESALGPELRQLRECKAHGILFLDVSLEKLRRHKESDASRKRGSFDFPPTDL